MKPEQTTVDVRACEAHAAEGTTDCNTLGCMRDRPCCSLRASIGHPRDLFPGVAWEEDNDYDHVGWTGELAGASVTIGFGDERKPGELPWSAAWDLGMVDVTAETFAECIQKLRDEIARYFARGLVALVRAQAAPAKVWPPGWEQQGQEDPTTGAPRDVEDPYEPGVDEPPARCCWFGHASTQPVELGDDQQHFAALVTGTVRPDQHAAALDAAALAWLCEELARPDPALCWPSEPACANCGRGYAHDQSCPTAS